MKSQIIKELNKIENKHNIKIILACESGSRAWGFPSNDSDYDVRFIYVNSMDWYLTITQKKDIIEFPINNDLDINGWDLRKSLQLMQKSNSPLLEWLSSPIQYHVLQKHYNSLLNLSKETFLPETSCHHYLSMAKNFIKEIEANDRIKLKKYMYAIRPILCCEWIIKYMSQPPMQMVDLISDIINDKVIEEKVNGFIEQKRLNSEKFLVNRSKLIDNYINQKIVKIQENIPKNQQKIGVDVFDDVFKYIIREVNI